MGLYYDNFYVYPFSELVNAYGYRPEVDEAGRKYPYTPSAFARELANLFHLLMDDFQANPRERYNNVIAANTYNQIRMASGLPQPAPGEPKFSKPPGYFKLATNAGLADPMTLNPTTNVEFWKAVKLLTQHLDQVGGKTKYWYDYVRNVAERYLISLKNFPSAAEVVTGDNTEPTLPGGEGHNVIPHFINDIRDGVIEKEARPTKRGLGILGVGLGFLAFLGLTGKKRRR